MKDPARLLEASATELERHLLHAAASELPPAAAMQRLAAKLGVRVSVADSIPSVAPKLPLWAASKGALIGVGVLGIGVSVWLAARTPAPTPADHTDQPTQSHMHPEAARAASNTSDSARQGANGDAALDASESVAPGARDNAAWRARDGVAPGTRDSTARLASDGATRSAAPGASDHATRSAAPSNAALPSASGRDARSLRIEITRIDTVRRHLAAHRAKHALAALQAYERDFPEGALSQEAKLLAIEAHALVGDRERAHELASRFLAKHPDSPHHARVRELLDAFRSHAR